MELSKTLKYIRPSPTSVFKCHHPQGIKFLTRLHLSLSHPREHKFIHSFQDSLNPLCKCGFEVESTFAVLKLNRSSLLSSIRNTDCTLLENTDTSLTQTLLYGNTSLDINSLISVLQIREFYMVSQNIR